MKHTIIALALLASCASASAQVYDVHTTWGRGYAHTTVVTIEPAPIVRHVPGPRTDEEQHASDERMANWVARCNPRRVLGADGITRYQYSAPHCDMGD